jgi:hypothetical protein
MVRNASPPLPFCTTEHSAIVAVFAKGHVTKARRGTGEEPHGDRSRCGPFALTAAFAFAVGLVIAAVAGHAPPGVYAGVIVCCIAAPSLILRGYRSRSSR